jgi:hypothetical protein
MKPNSRYQKAGNMYCRRRTFDMENYRNDSSTCRLAAADLVQYHVIYGMLETFCACWLG